jgi:ribosomal protein L7Ae-like RNA K-turn-binding protein
MGEDGIGKDPIADQRAPRVLGLLGLARRAGRLAMGATAVEKLVRAGPAPVVILARDAGEVQRRRLAALRPIRGVVDGLLDREQLAARLGRKDLVVVAVNDAGFVQGLIELGVVAEPGDGSAARS